MISNTQWILKELIKFWNPVSNLQDFLKLIIITLEQECSSIVLRNGDRWLRPSLLLQGSCVNLPPTYGLPRIILTFEVWDIVVNLHRFHMQMLAPPMRHFLPQFVCTRMVSPVIFKTFHLRCLTNGQNPRLKRIVLSPGFVSCFWRKMRRLAILLKQDRYLKPYKTV